MKPLEIITVVTYLSLVLLLIITHFNTIFSEREKILNYLEKFYTGRFIIKTLTESSPFALGICNLTANFTKIFNEDTYLLFLNSNNIKIPVRISAQYLNGTLIGDIGGTGSDVLEFRRVCNYNGQIVLIRVLV